MSKKRDILLQQIKDLIEDHSPSDYLEMVEEFHKLFAHPVLNHPQIPSKERCDLRVSLLTEELKELNHAIEQKNLTEIADAFADLQYVLSGAILEFGMANIFPELFAEVHSSNMSKACHSHAQAEATVVDYRNNTSLEAHIVHRSGMFFVYRSQDMKTVKSIDYRPADLERIVKRALPQPIDK